MKLPLPDFQKDIKVGDLSFVYKGVYHPIHWEGDIPYRPRVENIVVRNGREIFLRVYDNPKPGFEYRYRLPGGSLDNDSTKIQQAENETNEEALLKVKNIQYSGIKYFEQFPEGHLLKDGDICLEYKGNVTDVFVSEYNGKFDKTKVEEHDLDDDMANNGKFYHISLHCRILRPEHVDALLRSDLVDENVKSIMRRVLRGDIEATKKVKDSDMYTEIIPNSIVTESAVFEELQPVPRHNKIYHGSPAQGIKVLTPQKSRSYPEYGPIVFGSEYPDFVACFGTYWRDDVMRQSSQIKNGKISVILKVVDRRILKDWNKPCSMYELVNDGNFKRLPNHKCEVINNNPVKVKKEISFASFWDMIDPYNIEVVDSHTGQKITKENYTSLTESSNVHELESVDISSRIFHGSPTQNIKEVKAFHNDRIYSDLGPVIFCSEYKNFAGCYGTRWNDKTMKLYTSFDEGRLSAVSIAVLDKEIMNEWDKPCSLYELENDGNFKRLPNHPCEIINPNSVKVKKEIKFNNFYEMIKACNIEVRIGDDNGLVSVATESYNLHAKGFYHISPQPNLTTLRASVPNNYMTKNGFEDSKTPRVCFSPTVDQCLMALSKKCEGAEFYVYVPVGRYKYHKATIKEVPDSSITGEVWIVDSEVVNVRCVGKIRVVGDKGADGIPYTYGNKTAELYEWDWEPISEAIITEASTRSKLPDSAFGIPEERKYELDTKKHVLSAIKLFNWVEDKYEKELAQNILKKIDEFDIKEDEIHMTEKNRFYKYYYKTGDGK